jgi:hypothetical protein
MAASYRYTRAHGVAPSVLVVSSFLWVAVSIGFKEAKRGYIDSAAGVPLPTPPARIPAARLGIAWHMGHGRWVWVLMAPKS